jgi:hypothetical protein
MRMLMRAMLALILLVGLCLWARAADTPELLARIKAVGKEGKGNAAASQAWAELVRQGPEALLPTLAAFDDASPPAANWLRPAVDAIAERAHQEGKLSAADLEKFVRDTRRAGPARRQAYHWLVKLDPAARERLLPGMLDDPGQELRRAAVELHLEEANAVFTKDDKAAALALYRKLAGAARDRDQVKFIAERLGKLGAPIDLTRQFGFITQWKLAGPFDNTKGAGFRTAYPPEKGVDLSAVYTGKNKQEVRWIDHAPLPPLGLVDLNKLFKEQKGDMTERMREAAAFAYTVVESKEERLIEVRAASNNALRIWLNGKEIFFREEYHHGVEIDQHVGKGTLRAGRNEILVKVCQNHQDEEWARQWSFQLRICDAIGGSVPVTVVTLKLPATSGGE